MTPSPQAPLSIEPYLRVRAAAGASFSADGARFAYRSNESGLAQLWVLDLATGQTSQQTAGEDRVTFAQYAPVGQALIYGSDRGGNERTQFFHIPAPGALPRPITSQLEVVHNWGQWSPDGRSIAYSCNRRLESAFDVYVQEIPGGEPRLVLRDDGANYPVCWSPSSDALIVKRATSTANADLYLLDLRSGEARLLTPHEGDARYGAVDWSLDGRSLTLITDVHRDKPMLAHMDLATGALTPLAEPDSEVEAARLSPDGRLLAWRTNDDGFSALHVRDLESGNDLALPALPTGVIGETRWSPDSRRYAFGFSGHSQSSDVWLLDLDVGAVRRLTESSLAGLEPATFMPPELVHFTSFDGLKIPAFLYRPPGKLAPYPTIVSVHGGPESQERPGFNALFQYYVQRGYAVLAPNVRGSTGYGRRYSHLDDVRLRMDSVRDLAAAWEWLVASGVGDRARIAIMGGSYGGFMVLAALTQQPDLWAAGVETVGIANFVTFLENTGAYRRALRESEYGSLERDREFLESISPIHHVDKIRAPLMVIHGANDPRVPVGEAEQIVARLRARGATVEYLRFEDEGHGLAKLENRLVAYPQVADFLDRVLR